MEWESLKQYIALTVHWDCEGDRDYNDDVVPDLEPTGLYVAGGVYSVDRIRKDGRLPSFMSGGYGIRYTARTSCESQNNYGKCYYLYYEGHGQLGRWRYGDEYIAVDVIWGADGTIVPTGFYLGDGHYYKIPARGILSMYRMSSRKTDGSGMKYIVKATCRTLHDYNREFELMLENGGVSVGRWFYEDADTVHKCRVLYAELDNDAFNRALIDEEMGVSSMCARFQISIDVTDFLKDWNAKNGIWLSPEAFQKKVDDGIIYPKDYYPVMKTEQDSDNKVVPDVMRWGLERSWSKKPLINLRCDSLASKDTFNSIKANRCVIPCGGFYEFYKVDNKVAGDYLFGNPDDATVYLAGLYEQTESGARYTILTTDANDSINDIHNRMPVVLSRSEVKAWLYGRIDFKFLDSKASAVLARKQVA